MVKKRITEVTIILNFRTNIIQISENANLSDRNFTAISMFVYKITISLNKIKQNNGIIKIKSLI